jgi:uncharacterized protein (DUF849 family)
MACVQERDPKSALSATGIGRTALPLMPAFLALGGHVRVGIEGTLDLARGEPVPSNASWWSSPAADGAGVLPRGQTRI